MQNSFRLNPTKNIIDELSKESSRFEKYGLTKEAEEIISSTKKKHRSGSIGMNFRTLKLG